MISAIIPVYNGERYIKSLVNDLEHQTCKDFEAIFINDGSQDNSLDMLKEIPKNASFKMKLITQSNKGVSAARNAGLDVAAGELITFIDVDDNISVNLFEYAYKAASRCDADLYVFKSTDNPKNLSGSLGSIKSYTSLLSLKMYLFHKIQPSVWGIFVKRQLLKRARLGFAEGYKYCEDLHMVWRIMAYAKRVASVDAAIYIYNSNEGSAMRHFTEDRFHAVLLMQDLEDFFQKQAPEFYPLYKRYAVARVYWALLWQSAYYYSWEEFHVYYKEKGFKKQLEKLLTFREMKVAISSFACLLSPKLFYYAARKYAERRLKPHR